MARPRGYDEEEVLKRALATFWEKGYSGTSIVDIERATGLNKSSLYSGIGNKQAIYIKVMQLFRDYAQDLFGGALEPQPDDRGFVDVIERYLRAAMLIDGNSPCVGVRGCAVISTATAEAVNDPQIRAVLDEVLQTMDMQLHVRLEEAVRKGELPAGTPIRALGLMITSIAHSIGIRARAGQQREDVEALLRPSAELLFRGISAVVRSVPA